MGGAAGGGALEDPLAWVESVARQVARRTGAWGELDELVGLGAQGLVDAERRFDASRGVPFAAYARPRVEGAMLDGLRASAAQRQSVPRAAWAGGEAGERFRARFAAARAEGLLAATVDEADGPVATAPPEAAPEAIALQRELRRLLARALADLPEAEQLLVVRHGLGDEPLGEVAAGLGLGAERGRLLYRRALLRLRSRLRALA
jgi:RNA polymerase sigma factor for flagellar operon FliA